MKNKDWGRGRGGLIERGELINFPPLKTGGLNRGFTLFCIQKLKSTLFVNEHKSFLTFDGESKIDDSMQ